MPSNAEPITITLGTATPGGGFPLFGDALIAAMAEVDPTLTLEPRNTKGSTENVPLLEAGKLDIALVQGEVAQGALGGDAPALRIVAAMYSTPGMFVTRGDSAARRIGDLRGKLVVFGARGSGLVLLARSVLGGIGLDPERDFQAIFLDRAGDGPELVMSGKAAALWGGGIGWPGFTKVASGPSGARFITPDAAEIPRILAAQPFLKPMTVAAGSYPGQDAPIASVGSWSFILARPGLDDAVAYRFAHTLNRAEPSLAARLAQARETTAANTLAAAPRVDLIHAGVRRYLREIGLVT